MPAKTADSRIPSGDRLPGFLRTFLANTDWEDRAVTAVATTVAVMVVAAVAILMGMV
jgi:hypothetical protein